MSRKQKPAVEYVYRGMVERGAPRKGRPGYTWIEGWSEDGPGGTVSFPWLTRRECQQDAKERGCRAVFVRRTA